MFSVEGRLSAVGTPIIDAIWCESINKVNHGEQDQITDNKF